MFTSKSLNIRKRWPPSWWSVACSALSQTVRTKAPCLYLLPRVPGVVITRFLFYSMWFPVFISFTLSINYYRNAVSSFWKQAFTCVPTLGEKKLGVTSLHSRRGWPQRAKRTGQ